MSVIQWVKKSKIMKDSMLVGVIGGTIGASAMEFSNFLLIGNSRSRVSYGRFAASMVVNKYRSTQIKNLLFGEIFHHIVGASIGTVTISLLKKTGKDFTIFKSIAMGLAAWGFLYNLGHKLNLFGNKSHSTTSHYLALTQHILFGLTTATVIKYFASPTIFQQLSMTKAQNVSLNKNTSPVYSIATVSLTNDPAQVLQ